MVRKTIDLFHLNLFLFQLLQDSRLVLFRLSSDILFTDRRLLKPAHKASKPKQPIDEHQHSDEWPVPAPTVRLRTDHANVSANKVEL